MLFFDGVSLRTVFISLPNVSCQRCWAECLKRAIFVFFSLFHFIVAWSVCGELCAYISLVESFIPFIRSFVCSLVGWLAGSFHFMKCTLSRTHIVCSVWAEHWALSTHIVPHCFYGVLSWYFYVIKRFVRNYKSVMHKQHNIYRFLYVYTNTFSCLSFFLFFCLCRWWSTILNTLCAQLQKKEKKHIDEEKEMRKRNIRDLFMREALISGMEDLLVLKFHF